MHYLRLIGHFARTSFQEEAAYRANFFLSLMYSLLNLGTGVLGVAVLFNKIQTLNGWDFTETLALLGVYLTTGALRNLVIGPSLEALAGLDGEVWSGRLDFTLLRPVNTQFMASFRKWRLFSFFDIALGLGVLGIAVARMNADLKPGNGLAFLIALIAGGAILYAILLAFTAMVFWGPGVLFTWVFNGVFQMARYPLGMYPGWLRLILTWIIPVGIITTVPAGALTRVTTTAMLAGMVVFAILLVMAASVLFQFGLRRYKSASS
jgi:viologen exporter family transport system permease protein